MGLDRKILLPDFVESINLKEDNDTYILRWRFRE